MYVAMITFLCPFLLESKIEDKIAMKTRDILKATYLIALIHNSNESIAYLFKISRYKKYFETRTKLLLCGIKEGVGGGGVRLISSIALKIGRASPFLLCLLDSLMISNILAKFKKICRADFF